MERKSGKKKIIAALSLLAILIGAGLGVRSYLLAAAEDEMSLMPESVHIKSDDIENATLVVGSHLIYIGAITDELYEIAEDSAETFSQHEMYYKSELSGGTWYEISNATSIADISTSGTVVKDSVVEELSFTHHTKSDGITYDLVTDEAVSMFDISDPYDLSELEELQPLLVQYQLLLGHEQPDDAEKTLQDMIRIFFAEDVRPLSPIDLAEDDEVLESFSDELLHQTPDDLQNMEDGLSGLQKYMDSLDITTQGSERERVSEVMAKIDASRREYVLVRVYVLLDNMGSDVQNITADGESSEDEESTEVQNSSSNTDVLNAVIESQQNIIESLNGYDADALSGGNTVLEQEEYRICTEMMEAAASEEWDNVSESISEITCLDNIKSGIVEDAEAESAYMESQLLPKAEEAYTDMLTAGVSEEYQLAKAGGVPEEILDSYLEEQQSELNAALSEFEYVLSAATSRLDSEEAQALLSEKMNELEAVEAEIPDDDMKSKATETVGKLSSWLEEAIASQVQDSNNNSEMNQLLEEKQSLQEQKQDALDKNELAEAKRIDALIEAKNQEISDLEQSYTDIINSDTATPAEKAIASAQLGTGTAGAAALELANDIVEEIQEGNTQNIANALSSLDALMNQNCGAVTAALGKIKDAIDTAGAGSPDELVDDEVMEELNDMIAEGQQKIAQTGFSTTSELEEFLKDLLGTSFQGLDEEQKLCVTLALEQYGELNNNNAAKSLAASYADTMKQENSKYVYTKLSGKLDEYIPLQRLSVLTGDRYVYESSRTQVTITSAGTYYTFVKGKDTVQTMSEGESATETMSQKAELGQDSMKGKQNPSDLYIIEDYILEKFGYESEYIEQSSAALLYNSQDVELAEDIFDALSQKGGN